MSAFIVENESEPDPARNVQDSMQGLIVKGCDAPTSKD
jgi:hypothetical protein